MIQFSQRATLSPAQPSVQTTAPPSEESPPSAEFDVVVIGAGPAGGHCARQLAEAGRRVLLVERHSRFTANSFSSAATPLETMDRYRLPDWIVGSTWQRLTIVTSKAKGVWEAAESLGTVLDFSKLRQFLAEAVQAAGGEVWLGHRYLKHHQQDDRLQVTLKAVGNPEPVTVITQVLVDATGAARSVIHSTEETQPRYLEGSGSEYLIEVDPDIYQRYAGTLTFFLGSRWIPGGYSWIFPMDHNQLKVGAGLIKPEQQEHWGGRALKTYIDRLIQEVLQIQNYRLIEVHGSVLKYRSGLRDRYFQGNVIAIGDAVSTVNVLGGEGIRFALQGAEIAVRHIQHKLAQPKITFHHYKREMHRTFRRNWNLTEALSRQAYLEVSDSQVDRIVAYLQPFTLAEVIEILFNYRFEKLSRGIWIYLLGKMGRRLYPLFRSLVRITNRITATP